VDISEKETDLMQLWTMTTKDEGVDDALETRNFRRRRPVEMPGDERRRKQLLAWEASENVADPEMQIHPSTSHSTAASDTEWQKLYPR